MLYPVKVLSISWTSGEAPYGFSLASSLMMLSTGRPSRVARCSGSSGPKYSLMSAMARRTLERPTLGWMLIKLPQADFDRRRVRVQPLGVRNGDGGRAEAPNVVRPEREDGCDLEKVVEVERRAEAGCAASRHDVAGAGRVVANRLGRPL